MFTIHAKLNHPDAAPGQKLLYAFSDPSRNLIGEPLMEAATSALMHLFVFDNKSFAPSVTINFTRHKEQASRFRAIGYSCILTNPRPKENLHQYKITSVYPSCIGSNFDTIQSTLDYLLHVWLRPALLNYFDTVPREIYVQILDDRTDAP